MLITPFLEFPLGKLEDVNSLKLVSQQRSQGKRVECTLLQIKDFIVEPNFDLLFTNLRPFMYDLAITKI
jgi:hypothetical protein